MAELKNLTFDLEYMPIPVLKIQQCNAKSIPRNSFSNFSIKSFSSSCPFSDIDDNSLEQINSLRELRLLTTEFTEIPAAVGRLADLRVLYVNDGKLTRVKMEVRNMTRLRELSLKNNKISLIAEKAFYGNSNLKTIDLSENNLMSLSPATFEESRKLKKVLLQVNKLDSTKGWCKLKRGGSLLTSTQEVLPPNWGGIEPNRTVINMVLKVTANDKRKNYALVTMNFLTLDLIY
ncbi:carboxypeptidase N subunit 2 [Trichonephila clavipes]|nr:carboxypeptidase N subunit 2 [Trichonephila clavipes]